MSTSDNRPEYSRIAISGFLGFPHQDAKTLDIDGDIVLLTGANGAGKSSLLEAIAWVETGECCRHSTKDLVHRSLSSNTSFRIQIGNAELEGPNGNKETEVASARWWQREEGNRKRNLRTVYFHPHYLEMLFEENSESAGASFLDLLAPPPQAAVDLRNALSASVPTINARINQLEEESGFMSDTQQHDLRRKHAAEFNAAIDSWKNSSPTSSDWLSQSSEYRLVLKNGNMSASWAGQLFNLVNQSLEKLDDFSDTPGVTKTSPPQELLRKLSEASQLVADKYHEKPSKSPETEISQSVLIQLANLLPEQWKQLKLSHEEAKTTDFSANFKEKQLVEKLDNIRRVRNELGRGDTDFPDWIANFVERSRRWADILTANHHPLALPEDFTYWLKNAGHLTSQWEKIDPIWAEWSAQIDDTEKQLAHELEVLRVQRATHRNIRNIVQELESFFSLRPNAREIFANAKNAPDFLIALEKITNSPPRPTLELRKLVETFVAVCQSWADFERNVTTDQERRNEPDQANSLRSIENLRELREAVQTESGTGANARLASLQQEAIVAALDPLQAFLNEAANHFRIFDNILPIRLLRLPNKKQGDRLGFRVGHPPREMSQTSSGQRSQLGLLTFLALHYGLRDTYQSKVICLDEVTSNFDLAQVPRLALLLRQIAYAPVDSPFRRRVFIASHNEEFSQRLAELLTPPRGNTLRVLRFTGFDQQTGPIIQSHSIQPALPFDPQRLKSYFSYRYGAEGE